MVPCLDKGGGQQKGMGSWIESIVVMAISPSPILNHDEKIHWQLHITIQNRIEIRYTKYRMNCDNTIQYYKKVQKEVCKLNYWFDPTFFSEL